MSLRDFNSWLEDGAPELAPGAAEGTTTEQKSSPRNGKPSLLEEMERERMMWESKTIALCGSSSRPSTANASAFAGSTTAPCTPGSAAPSTGVVRASSSVFEPQQIHEERAAEEAVDGGLASRPDEMESASTQNKVEDIENGQTSGGPPALIQDDADEGPGLIAAALLAAGLDNCDIEPVDAPTAGDLAGADVMPSTPSKWSSAAKTWAAERLRKKKDRGGLRSGAATPCGSTGLRSGAASPCHLDAGSCDKT